ncbi:MAG: hypothetical protein QOF37_1099 [Thermoleophilaceae bacterium]|nr:hypothetical protein [Thermoleophilaceae bacterium]
MPPPPLHDLACVVHLHTTHSDGTGTVADVVAAARRNALDVVLLTDHDTLGAKPEEGWHGDVLLLVGEEVSPRNRDHTLVFGVDEPLDHRDRPIAEVAGEAPLAFAAHPFSRGSDLISRFRGMPHSDPFADSITGVELWSFVTDTAEQARSLRDLALMVAAPERALRHPPAHNLAEWDRACLKRRVVAIGGVDAHQVGIRVGGHVPLRLMSYARSFRLIHTHVLCQEQPTGEVEHDRAQVYDALREGRCYIANDALAPARGFAFWGEETLHVRLPRPAEIRLIRNGEPLATVKGAALDHVLEEPGVHRVEARLGDRTWILSNPIYSS